MDKKKQKWKRRAFTPQFKAEAVKLASRAELARRVGVSRARVTQALGRRRSPAAATGEAHRRCAMLWLSQRRGPYATPGPSFTALPSTVQLEAERDVISIGEVPRVIVRSGAAGIGRFNETSEFTVTKPDGSKNDGPCDSAREPEASAGFAALNFKCHPLVQLGVYTIRFEPMRSGLPGEPSSSGFASSTRLRRRLLLHRVGRWSG